MKCYQAETSCVDCNKAFSLSLRLLQNACYDCYMFFFHTLRKGALLAGAKLNSNLRCISSKRKTSSAGPSRTSSRTLAIEKTFDILHICKIHFKYNTQLIYKLIDLCVKRSVFCLFTLVWSSESRSERDSRPHCRTLSTSMSSSLKNAL